MDHDATKGWKPLCAGLAALSLLLGATFALLYMEQRARLENWKGRWQADTTALSHELKTVAQKLAEESYRKVQAEHGLAQLQERVADLEARLASSAVPPAPAP